MTYDFEIQISTANTRMGPWQNQRLMLSEFYARLSAPARGTETRAAYLAMPKREQDRRKDVGGFVGGPLQAGLRRNGHVLSRSLITLDIDKVEAGGTDRVLQAVEALGCGYAVYSTRKHAPETPRLRVVIPVAAPLSADEYEPAARVLARCLDPEMQIFDRTTFEACRLMYWPSCCCDSDYVCRVGDKPPVDGKALLTALPNWHDVSVWPRCPDESAMVARAAEKQADPRSKEGLVGAFCRVYDIEKAIDTFLPGVYTRVSDDRFTYAAGSTSGGAVLYENGTFLYSHHATDPAGGHLCNAFDLVRLHRFGAQDDDARPGTPTSRLPSYRAMCQLASADAAVTAQMDRDSEARVQAEFSGIAAAQQAQPQSGPGEANPTVPAVSNAAASDGMTFHITRTDTGKVETTINNAWAILETDKLLLGRIVTDVFQGRGVAQGPYPWNPDPTLRFWTDNDDNGVLWYLEKMYQFSNQSKVLAALSLCGQRHAVDPVRNYLDALVWDGRPRLDTLFVDRLGAEDTVYTRAVTRKALVAAVARTYEPGCKFDNMLILTGPTGIGKSTCLNKLGGKWFNDSLQTFEGKESRELIQGAWIVEVGELGKMSMTEVGQVKQFLSQQNDIFRAAYGRHTESHPRRCVIFGTSNDYDYLRDKTGNRRFWPVDVGKCEHSATPFDDFTSEEVDQVWAEAVARYRLGESLYLTGEAGKQALGVQDEHTEADPIAGVVCKYLDEPVPEGWDEFSDSQIRAWLSGVGVAEYDESRLVHKDKVCAAEIWEFAFNRNPGAMRPSDARNINSIIRETGKWKYQTIRTKKYGVQKGWKWG